MSSLFEESAFDETKPRDPTVYVGPGDHLFEVIRHKYVEDHDAFVAELKVVQSVGIDGQPGHMPGQTVSLFIGNGGPKFAEANRREIKNYVRAVLAVDDVSAKQVMGTTTEEGNALVAGRRVKCQGRMNKTGRYCKKSWAPAGKSRPE